MRFFVVLVTVIEKIKSLIQMSAFPTWPHETEWSRSKIFETRKKKMSMCKLHLFRLHFDTMLDAVFRLIKMHGDSDHSIAELSDGKFSTWHVQTSLCTAHVWGHESQEHNCGLALACFACTSVCLSEPLAPERVRCLSKDLMGRQHQRRCKDERIWVYFCPCGDSAVLHSALVDFRTTDCTLRRCRGIYAEAETMQGNILWSGDDWSCLSLLSFPCIVILQDQNSGGRGGE